MAMSGRQKHLERVRRLGSPYGQLVMGRALYAAGNLVQTTAQIKITQGAVSGKGHQPSKPGQAPNQDTGVLSNNIEAIQRTWDHVEVSSNAPYAADLEYGTKKMAERPYMRPARDETKKDVQRLINRAIDRVMKR